MDKIVEIMKAASDPTRIRILMSLLNGELCACQITALLDLAPSTVSKHMSILKHAGFIKNRKEGKWIYFCLDKFLNESCHKIILDTLFKEVCNSPLILSDKVKLEKILLENQDNLCSRICNSKFKKGN